jgi:hypothetical protein
MKLFRTLVITSLVILALAGGSWSAVEDHGFPRLANYYLSDITVVPAATFSSWDLLILACSWNQPSYLAKLDSIRAYSPEISLLAYIQSCGALSKAGTYPPEITYTKVYNKVDQEDWWLYGINGEKLGTGNDGQGGWVLNLINVCPDAPTDSNGDRFIDWFPGFIEEEILATGRWDGIFLDVVWQTIAWRNIHYPGSAIDSNRDGIADDEEWLDQRWSEGLDILTSGLRDLLGDEYLISSNGNNTYHQALNGCMRENFPQMHGDWEYNIADTTHGYMAIEDAYREPNTNVISGFWQHTLNTPDEPYTNYNFWNVLSYDLASTLVFGNGYFAFDGGDYGHRCLWWLDVYDIDLGDPLSQNEDVNANPGAQPSDPWGYLFCQRRFENGVAVVNATETLQEIYLDGIHYDAFSFNGDFYSYHGLLEEIELSSHSGGIFMTADMIPDAIDTVAHTISPGKPTLLEWALVPGAGRYAIYRAGYDSFYPDGSKLLGTTMMPRFADYGSSPDSVFYYRVSAISPAGFEGPPTETLEVVWTEEDPGVSGHTDGEKIYLRWPATPYREYVVTRDDDSGKKSRWRLAYSPLSSDDRFCTFEDSTLETGSCATYRIHEIRPDRTGQKLVGTLEFARADEDDKVGVIATEVWPNPSQTGFYFSMPWSGPVRMEIYDVQGRLVRSIEDLDGSVGTAHWSGMSDYGRELPSGTYFYRLMWGEEESRGKLTLVR